MTESSKTSPIRKIDYTEAQKAFHDAIIYGFGAVDRAGRRVPLSKLFRGADETAI